MIPSIRFFCCKLNSNKGFDHLATMITKGMSETNSIFTPEYLAGQYAYWQATETFNVDLRAIKKELTFLKEIGAKFDREKAYLEALEFKKIMALDHSKAIWV